MKTEPETLSRKSFTKRKAAHNWRPIQKKKKFTHPIAQRARTAMVLATKFPARRNLSSQFWQSQNCAMMKNYMDALYRASAPPPPWFSQRSFQRGGIYPVSFGKAKTARKEKIHALYRAKRPHRHGRRKELIQISALLKSARTSKNTRMYFCLSLMPPFPRQRQAPDR